MVPVIELRGAIPYGVDMGLNYWQAFAASLAGSIIVCIVVMALLIPIFRLLKKIKTFARFIEYLENRFIRQASKLKYTYFSLFILALVPLPLTGIWTCSAVAVFLDLDYLKSLLAISAGTAVCGLLMVGITLLFGSFAIWIFYFFSIVAIITLAAILFTIIAKKPKTPQISV